MRCPICAKLYKADSALIMSSNPHFHCQVCHTDFTFDSPPKHPHSVQTRPLKLPSKNPSFSKAADLDFNENHFRKCPKCQHVNPKNVDECSHCHVIFSRVEGLPLEPRTGALPSLMKMWQDLMSDYDNLTKHVAFVDRCEDLQAIPFALKKYQSLKEAQPHDEVAQQMFHQVWLKSLGMRAGRMAEASQLKFLASKVNWPRVIKMSPLALSGLLILIGLFTSPLRNLVGLGAAIAVVTVGLRIFKSGRFQFDDYY